ncbi:vitamin B12 ABC transporter permease BtuC [Erwinia billingiae]|uniref:vitamin B12 ABC transporter permease BtuC n=1 Tax=Erwinia billingiae TaxID=182337 RepID=UPI001244131B|nr:vitamin B12 ABC transporter permease BtuC [Erwinia billingiae]QEW32489.1 vitamin B12 ABC transporter permease BtuC [Erwinia billingiae]
MTLLSEHMKSARQHQRRWLAGLMVFSLLMIMLSLSAGNRWLMPVDWFTPDNSLYVWQLRLPRTVAVLLVGASLAVAGAVMQALFENPLAEPGLLGVSNGAGVGLVLCIFAGAAGLWQISLSAIFGALVVTLILLRFSRQHLSNSRLLLAGVALGIICSAVMTWAVYFSTDLDLRQLMYWMMGGFSGVDWRYRWLMLALLPVLIWLCSLWRVMNLIALGEISARQLGLPLLMWRNLLVLSIGWLTGVSVALAGAIGFVGLVIPHILRLNGINDHRMLLPASALAGGAILLAADVLARVAMSSAELPIGVVTATLGAPVFIWLLLRNRP